MSMAVTTPSSFAEPEAASQAHAAAGECPIPWWKRLTLLAFLFFLVKGLAWLIVPAVIIWWRSVAG